MLVVVPRAPPRGAVRRPAFGPCPLAALVLSLVGCSASGPPAGAPGGAGSSPGGKSAGPVEVTVAAAVPSEHDEVVEVVGTLRPSRRASLAAEAEGRVLAVRADLGDAVATGQVLADIAPEELEFALARAAAEKAEADRELERIARLHGAGQATDADLDRARTRAAVAGAGHDLARKRRGDAQVRAPWAGRIAARHIDVGDYVRAGTPAFDIARLDPLELVADVPETWQGRLAPGTPLAAHVPGRAEAVAGRVTRVSPVVDDRARTFAVRAELPNPGGKTLAGTSARARFVVGRVAGAVAIPAGALASAAGIDRVFAIQGGQAREVPVTVVGRGAEQVVVTGLDPAARVAVRGVYQLRDGAAVTEDAPVPKGGPGAPR